jgi:hypothetical protein
MSVHHPSCRPSDKDLVWLCAQCGGHESAEAIEDGAEFLSWIRDNCKVIYYPPGEGLPYPIEHSLPAGKNQWDELMHRAVENRERV